MSKEHVVCPECGKKNNWVYDDGHEHCYTTGCDHHTSTATTTVKKVEHKVSTLKYYGVSKEIPDRKLTQDTVEKYGVKLTYGTGGDIKSHQYPYADRDTGEVKFVKERIVHNKSFPSTGSTDNIGLFGEDKFSGKGKYITVVEGELDACSAYQMMGSRWPVVSVRSSNMAVNDIKNSLEFLEGYDNVVLCLDNDKAGQEATNKIVDLFSPNKAKVCTLPLKDARDMLVANRGEDFTKAWWNAKPYSPAGIISGKDTWSILKNKEQRVSIPYPWTGLNDLTYGFRTRELVTITSGSGMGKSQLVRELESYLLDSTDDNVAIMALEEGVDRSVEGLMSIEANLPVHLPNVREEIDDNEYEQLWEKAVGSKNIFFYDHFGSTSEDNLLSRIRYFAKALDCKWIVLDHLSIVVSDQEVSDERKAIDSIMTKLRQIVQETGIGLFLVSHLKRPQGKGHEEGASISLAELRGSAAIGQLSDMVIGLERNQQADDEKERNTTTVRVLKNRFAGLTGPATYLFYDRYTGRMTEVDKQTEVTDNADF